MSKRTIVRLENGQSSQVTNLGRDFARLASWATSTPWCLPRWPARSRLSRPRPGSAAAPCPPARSPSDDFKSVAETASMKRGRAEAIAREVAAAVARWREFAEQAGVLPDQIEKIGNAHRLGLLPKP